MLALIPFMPERASTFADSVDGLYFYLIGLTAFFTLLISFTIIFFVIKYRRRSASEVPRPIAGSLKLETLWSVIPFLIAMSIFVWGTSVYFAQYRMPKDALEIYVVGKQWMWKVQHTTGQREINELHIPVGRKIKLIMATEDVIHDFFVPAFRTKADVVPGRYTTLWFEATKPGRYRLFCAEYCGTNHSGMVGWVIVMEPTEFDAWLAGGTESASAAGQKVFQQMGCVSCHGANGEGGKGPPLTNVYGRRVEFESGPPVEAADEEYLRNSIRNPQSQIVKTYKQPLMPAYYPNQLSEEQLLQLIAYIKSLSTPKAPGDAGATSVPQPQGQQTSGASQGTTGENTKDAAQSNPVIKEQRK
ncbi:MAG TPA: cytochrome c oxidase subunit II [Pyrinomonadaceae bacterium]